MAAHQRLCFLLVCLLAALGITPADASHFTTLKGLASHLRALKQGGPTTLEGSGTDSTDNISANEDLGDRQTSQLSLGSGLTANPQQGRGVGSSIGRRLHQAADPSSMYKYAQQLVWGSVAGSWVGVDADSSGSKQHLQLGSSSMQQQGAVHHLVGGRCVTAGCAVASTAVAGTDAAATGAASSRDLVRSRRDLLQGDSSQPGGMSDTATGPASNSRSRRNDDDQLGSSLAAVVVAPGGLRGGRRLRQL